jgi:hypothetical protein
MPACKGLFPTWKHVLGATKELVRIGCYWTPGLGGRRLKDAIAKPRIKKGHSQRLTDGEAIVLEPS